MRKKTIGYNKILVSYKIDEDIINMFRSTSAFNGEIMGTVVERLIKNYITKHKINVEEKMKIFFDTKKKPA